MTQPETVVVGPGFTYHHTYPNIQVGVHRLFPPKGPDGKERRPLPPSTQAKMMSALLDQLGSRGNDLTPATAMTYIAVLRQTVLWGYPFNLVRREDLAATSGRNKSDILRHLHALAEAGLITVRLGARRAPYLIEVTLPESWDAQPKADPRLSEGLLAPAPPDQHPASPPHLTVAASTDRHNIPPPTPQTRNPPNTGEGDDSPNAEVFELPRRHIGADWPDPDKPGTADWIIRVLTNVMTQDHHASKYQPLPLSRGETAAVRRQVIGLLDEDTQPPVILRGLGAWAEEGMRIPQQIPQWVARTYEIHGVRDQAHPGNLDDPTPAETVVQGQIIGEAMRRRPRRHRA